MPDNAKSLPEGLYESLVTTEIAASLAGLPDELIEIEQIDPDHAPDVISLHLGRQIERALLRVPQDQRLQMGSRIAEALMKQLDQFLKTEEYEQQRIDDRFGILKSISSYLPDGTKRGILEPLSSLAETTLITNSSHEPRVGSQLKREIASANSISIIMAFITQGGINQFITEMKQFCTDGRMGLLTL